LKFLRPSPLAPLPRERGTREYLHLVLLPLSPRERGLGGEGGLCST